MKQHHSFFEGLAKIDKVVVIGHSLYPVDWEYFAKVLQMNEAPDQIQWYFGCYSGADLERVDQFMEHFKIKKEQVSIFRTDIIRMNYKEMPTTTLKNNSSKKAPSSKLLAVSDDGAWKVLEGQNKISIIDKKSGNTVFARTFTSCIHGAVFDKSGTVLLLVMRGCDKGVFLFRYDSNKWNYITELQEIPHQGVITKRLKRIFLHNNQLVFKYNSRIRKYNLSDGSLVYNQSARNRKENEVVDGEDLTERFLRIYRNGFY